MQTQLSHKKSSSGFTLVEIILVIVIMGIVITMVSNPGILRQRDSVTAQKASSLLSSFLDQRKLDKFLGKKLGDMYVDELSVNINRADPTAILTLDYQFAPSRTQEVFEGFLPEDTNLTYFFHTQDFRCEETSRSDTSLTLACGYQDHIADFLSIDMITCSTSGSESSGLANLNVTFRDKDILFPDRASDVRFVMKVSFKQQFSRDIYWDRRTGVIFDVISEPNSPLTCAI